MRSFPLPFGPLHFVGIGGIGMSGIAEVLHRHGHRVSGSDAAEGAQTTRLRRLGVRIAIGHADGNLGDAAALVVSTAIPADNPECAAAKTRGLPILHRSEALAALMHLSWSVAVSGTHGKTTTTAMIAGVLEAGGLDPTVVNGGILNGLDSNVRCGGGEWTVAEADESDRSFLNLPATVAVVTNIEAEHMEHYRDLAEIEACFARFVAGPPPFGAAVLNADQAAVRDLARDARCRILTYGFSPDADIRGSAPEPGADGSRLSVGGAVSLPGLRIGMPGRHNASNALAAVAVGHLLGVPDEAIRHALAEYRGVQRRFTRTGVVDGVCVIDDYGHHPTEIAAVLATARQCCRGRVLAAMQPHRYTRLHALMDGFAGCFGDADKVLIAPVYAAGEAPIAGADRDSLVAAVRAGGHTEADPFEGPEDLVSIVRDWARPGDTVVCLGAGSISAWAHALPEGLRR